MTKTKAGREQYRIRYNSAKSAADLLNGLVTDIQKIVGVELSADQLQQLAGQFRSFDSSFERANETYERYRDFCERFDYEEKEITYLV